MNRIWRLVIVFLSTAFFSFFISANTSGFKRDLEMSKEPDTQEGRRALWRLGRRYLKGREVYPNHEKAAHYYIEYYKSLAKIEAEILVQSAAYRHGRSLGGGYVSEKLIEFSGSYGKAAESKRRGRHNIRSTAHKRREYFKSPQWLRMACPERF